MGIVQVAGGLHSGSYQACLEENQERGYWSGTDIQCHVLENVSLCLSIRYIYTR